MYKHIPQGANAGGGEGCESTKHNQWKVSIAKDSYLFCLNFPLKAVCFWSLHWKSCRASNIGVPCHRLGCAGLEFSPPWHKNQLHVNAYLILREIRIRSKGKPLFWSNQFKATKTEGWSGYAEAEMINIKILLAKAHYCLDISWVVAWLIILYYEPRKIYLLRARVHSLKAYCSK